MAKNFSLQVLRDLAQRHTDAAARDLGLLHAQGQDLERQLQLLQQYREDYQARFRESLQRGMDPTGWRNFQEFMNRLDAAIAEQHEALAHSSHRIQAGQAEWRAQQRKLKSYDTLTQRHVRSEARRTGKLEQREQDEHASKLRTDWQETEQE